MMRKQQLVGGGLCGLLALQLPACENDAPQLAPTGGSRADPAAPPAAAAPVIVFLGDSLTAGLGLPEAEALPARIQARVHSAGLPYRVINAGRSGDTTAGGLARLDWYFREGVEVHALVIGLGSNDAMRGLPLSSIEENLRQIIAKARQKRPNAKIFLWALETFPNMGKEYGEAYKAIFPRVAASEGVRLLPFPLEEVAARAELNQADGIHPNAEGTERVADRIWASLKPEL
jgi:acyl-CoA thioesterase I